MTKTKTEPTDEEITTKITAKVARIRETCRHDWKQVGFERESPVKIKIVYTCKRCSSFTYEFMEWVGYRLDDINDQVANEEDKCHKRKREVA